MTGLVACGDSGDEIAELRTEIPDLEVKDEDKLEIVTIVGGG